MAITLTFALTNTTAAVRTNTAITVPASSGADDILIAVLYVEDDVTVTPGAGDGWTQIATVDHAGQPMDIYAWWKREDSSPPASYSFAHSSSYSQGAMYRITGCETSGSPLDGTATTNQGTGTTATMLGLTTTQANSALVGIVGWWDALKAAGTGTLSSPLTERLDTTQLHVNSGIQASAGASGDKTAAISAAGTDEWFTIFFGLKEPASGTTMPPRPVIIRQAVNRASSW